MMVRGQVTAAALLLLAGTTPVRGEQLYLYSARPVDPAVKPAATEILVREIQIQKGDTLYGLSRRFSGNGSYYPQILLFNDIKDPDRIYAGSTLRLPVTASATADAAPARSAQVAAPVPVKPVVPAPRQKAAAPAAVTAGTQNLFEQGVKAYRRDDCSAALELFERFLAREPESPLAADAALYKAECYLKQSGR